MVDIQTNDFIGRRLLHAFIGRNAKGQGVCLQCKAVGGFELQHKDGCIVGEAGHRLINSFSYSDVISRELAAIAKLEHPTEKMIASGETEMAKDDCHVDVAKI